MDQARYHDWAKVLTSALFFYMLNDDFKTSRLRGVSLLCLRFVPYSDHFDFGRCNLPSSHVRLSYLALSMGKQLIFRHLSRKWFRTLALLLNRGDELYCSKIIFRRNYLIDVVDARLVASFCGELAVDYFSISLCLQSRDQSTFQLLPTHGKFSYIVVQTF